MSDAATLTSQLTSVLDLAGVAANALMGAALARSKRFDPVGFGTLAVVSGLGGGLLRDTLLQQGPPAALQNSAYLITAITAAAFAFLIRFEGRVWHALYRWVDAFAIGCWAAVGAQKTLAAGLGWLPAILLGALTAVGGGMIRDILVQRVPVVLGGNTLYATPALLASGVLVIFAIAGQNSVGMLVATATGAAFCLLASYRGWQLPAYQGYSLRWPRRPGEGEREDR